MKKSTLFRILLPLIMMSAGTTVKAQIVSTIADLNAATKAVYCSTDQVKITDQNGGTNPYTWTRYSGIGVGTAGSGTTVSGQTTASLIDGPITTPGYYTYVATITNTNGCQSDPSDPITVYVLPNINAVVNPLANPNACVSAVGTTTLTSTVSSATTVAETFAYTYQWYKGTSASSTLIPGATNADYTLSATNDATPGAENFFVKAYYKVKPTCTEGTAAPVTVTIVANPIKPVLVITP
jgi:hypothetical protein